MSGKCRLVCTAWLLIAVVSCWQWGRSANITVNDATTYFSQSAIGGTSSDATPVSGNSVTMLPGGQVGNSGVNGGRDISGGYNSGFGSTGDVFRNSVVITGGKVIATSSGLGIMGGDVNGGESMGTGNVFKNTVDIRGTAEIGSVVRGAYSSGGSGNVTDNEVTIGGDAIIAKGVFGGYKHGSDGTSVVSGNRVTVMDNATVIGGAIGGFQFRVAGDVRGNLVIIQGGTVGGALGGGTEGAGKISNNLVEIRGGIVDYGAMGGRSEGTAGTGEVSGNIVKISGGTVRGATSFIYGGWANKGNAIGNSVEISGAAQIYSGTIAGGRSTAGNATGNLVSLAGGAFINPSASVFGGISDTPGMDMRTGNTLNINGFRGNLTEVNNFQYYNFTLPAGLSNGGTLITIIGPNATDMTGSTVQSIAIASDNTTLDSGHSVVLIDKVTGTFTPATLLAAKGSSMYYDVQVELSGQQLLANLAGSHLGPLPGTLNPQTKAYGQVRIAGLTILNQAADLAIEQGLYQAALGSVGYQGRPAIFAATSLSDTRTETGSHLDADGWSFLTGLAWRCDRTAESGWLAGAFFETGHGSYDGYNSFTGFNAVHSSGGNDYWGGGAIGRYTWERGFRAEGSFRLGRLDSDYVGDGFIGGTRRYDVDTNYTSAHIGIGQRLPFAGAWCLDLSAKYLWTRQGSETVTVLGDSVRFDAVDSHRARAGGRLEYAAACVTPYAGAYFEYEFDGEAGASDITNNLIYQSLKTRGGSGIGELGVRFNPGGKNLNIDLAAQGVVGRREGVNGRLALSWTF